MFRLRSGGFGGALASLLLIGLAPAIGAEAPQITAVEPSPVPGMKAKQSFAVVGSGFHAGATVTLKDLTRHRDFPDLAPASVKATRIERPVNFGAVPSHWQVKIRNRDGMESAAFEFDVGGGAPVAAAAPAPAPAPAVVAATDPPAPAVKPPATPPAESKPAATPVSAKPASPARSVNVRPRLVAKVESVQSPAWVERRGVRASVKPGWAILAGDRFMTGPEGRSMLTLPGDAKLRVGGDTVLEFSDTSAFGYQPPGTERKLMRVSRGVLTFTAPAMQRAAMGAMTISLGGTDAKVTSGQIWAHVTPTETVVAQMDGVSELRGPGFNTRLDKPETFLTIPASGGPRPPSDLAREKLAYWLNQVETIHGKSVMVAGGGWDVGLRTGYDLRDLQDVARMLQAKGFPSEVTPVAEPGHKIWYRLAVRRFATENDARGFAQTARGLGFRDAWVMPPA